MLVRDGLELRYEVHGGPGPALLLPHLNFSWPDYLDLSLFSDRFTVITASPRGFAGSSRLDADLRYRVRDLADDLVAVTQASGFDRFFVFGYSFSGAFAPWIVHLTGKADAVVSGGFPIVGDYAYLYPDIRRRTEAAKSDPAAWADVDARGVERLASGLDRRGLRHVSFPDRDHEGMLAHIDDAVPAVVAWLDRL